MDIKATIVYQKNSEALSSDKRFIINQGGSRSSKTYSLCQWVIVYCLTHPKKTVSIVRKSFPSLRATVMRDFFEVLNELNIYDRNLHNKTENIYTFGNGASVEFFSCDDEQKLRGRKRDICWINEGNELLSDDFLQLNMRTSDKVIVDYNPSDADCWIYDLDPAESVMIKSTYRDNPFLERSIVKQIESLKYKDDALYQIYALGERTKSRKNIYSNWNFVSERPARFKEYIYGMDFGYNHPTALLRIWFNEDEIFIETLIYESYLTTSELVSRMEALGIDKFTDIMCDWARPEIIEELKMAGYSAKNANKSVKDGINNVKTFYIYALDSDQAIKKEYDNYMWKTHKDRILDEPVKLYDDAMDALRYAVAKIKENKTVGTGPLISF